ncbi:MAG: hypothetical protein J6B88_08260 [Clostridia bacterium]|nr:hypothetical protein [Clostridia bacterium]
MNYKFPECNAVIDVTKPPYNADNTGKTDCTNALCRVFDDICGEYKANLLKSKEKLEAMDDPNALITFEIRKVNGKHNVVFAEDVPLKKIIYFPNGTYLVSDTISYSIEEFRNMLFDLPYMEMNTLLRIKGESRDGVVIKLKDNCKGFEHGNDRPVISFDQSGTSNIAMSNMVEDITVNIGKGNPGATGIRYFANNTGAVRNVKIISEDFEFRGNTGFSVTQKYVSAGLVKNLEVIGFNYGIKVTSMLLNICFENITLKNQKRAGFYTMDTVVAIRNLKSKNTVPALYMEGTASFVSLVDAELSGGHPAEAAIRQKWGQLYLRNINCNGYELLKDGGCYANPIEGNYLEEYCAGGPVTLFDNDKKSINLPIEKTPETEWENPEKWVSVNSFGAKGDGITDDTEAIRAAMNSGAATVYFDAGKYLIDGIIEIPETVNRVNFMFCDLISGKNIASSHKTGVFKVVGESETPLVIEDLIAFEQFYGFCTFIEHASKRTLILSDLQTQAISMYFNSVKGGKVFIENVGNTMGGVPGAGVRTEPLPFEDKFPYSREVPSFEFNGQTVFAWHLNPERSLHEMVNNGGKVWVHGCKTEEEGTAFETFESGSTEVTGFIAAVGLNKEYPLVLNDNSNVSFFGTTFCMNVNQRWPIMVKEIRNGEEKIIRDTDMPFHYINNHFLPLYVGKEK